MVAIKPDMLFRDDSLLKGDLLKSLLSNPIPNIRPELHLQDVFLNNGKGKASFNFDNIGSAHLSGSAMDIALTDSIYSTTATEQRIKQDIWIKDMERIGKTLSDKINKNSYFDECIKHFYTEDTLVNKPNGIDMYSLEAKTIKQYLFDLLDEVKCVTVGNEILSLEEIDFIKEDTYYILSYDNYSNEGLNVIEEIIIEFNDSLKEIINDVYTIQLSPNEAVGSVEVLAKATINNWINQYFGTEMIPPEAYK